MSYQKISVSTVLTVPTEADSLNNSIVVLDVDSTSGAISITLPALSAFTYPFATRYVINDFAGTSSTNNITVISDTTAPDKINNTTSVILAQNGGALIITPTGLNDWASQANLGGLPIVNATATSDGLTTGLLLNGNCAVNVTSASANNIITLPAPIIGTTIRLNVGANGYKLQTSAPASVAINGGSGATAKSVVAANILLQLYCNSATTWISTSFTAAGVVAAGAVAS